MTGNPLFDDKAANTVHIAIGDNTAFGHTVRAQHHSDLNCRHPTLHLGGVELLGDSGIDLLLFKAKRDALIDVSDELPPGASVFMRDARVYLLPIVGKSVNQSVEMRMRLRPTFPVDLIVRTPEKVCERLEMSDDFMREILEEGMVLYEADRR